MALRGGLSRQIVSKYIAEEVNKGKSQSEAQEISGKKEEKGKKKKGKYMQPFGVRS